jgi:hypothetical protein
MAFSILSNIFWGIAKLHVLGIKILGTLRDALIMAKKPKKIRSEIKTYTAKKNHGLKSDPK